MLCMGSFSCGVVPKSPSLLLFITLHVKFASVVRSNLCLNVFNLNTTNFLWDPWCLGLPLACKRTYLNVDLLFENIAFSDSVLDNAINFNAVHGLLGLNVEWRRISKVFISDSEPKHWVRCSISTVGKIARAVYNHLNSSSPNDDYS